MVKYNVYDKISMKKVFKYVNIKLYIIVKIQRQVITRIGAI